MKIHKFLGIIKTKQFIIFLILISISTLAIQYIANELVLGCGTSPYGDFKSEYCDGVNAHKGRVYTYGREWISLPTSLLQAAAIEVLPLYYDHDIFYYDANPFSYSSTVFPVSGFFQFYVLQATDASTISMYIIKAIFLLIDILYISTITYILTWLWNKGTKESRLSVILIFVFVYKWSVLITIPITTYTSIF